MRFASLGHREESLNGDRAPSTALVLSTPFDPRLVDEVRNDREPEPDYLALARKLGVRLIVPLRPGPAPRTGIGKALRLVRVAWSGFREGRKHDVLITDLDRVGLMVAFLLKVSRSRTRHLLICHGKLAHPMDTRVVKLLGLDSHIHRIVCYGPEIAERVKRSIPKLAAKTSVVLHGQDHRFWRPLGATAEPLIVSAGLLNRDFDVVIRAVEGLDVPIVVAAHSPWVTNAHDHSDDGSPPNVHFKRLNYLKLREMYDRSRFVAVPLHPSHSQAGSLVVYEAMAMGKPVILTHTLGQSSLGLIEDGETGFYVEPGDVEGWRALIRRLLDNPELAEKMGRAARAKVESCFNLETYTDEMGALLDALGGPTQLRPREPEPVSRVPAPREVERRR